MSKSDNISISKSKDSYEFFIRNEILLNKTWTEIKIYSDIKLCSVLVIIITE